MVLAFEVVVSFKCTFISSRGQDEFSTSDVNILHNYIDGLEITRENIFQNKIV